jgi:hypothetical protein
VLEENYKKDEQPSTVFLESKYRGHKIYSSKEAAILAWLSQYNSPSTVAEKFELIRDEVVVNEQYTVPFAERRSYSWKESFVVYEVEITAYTIHDVQKWIEIDIRNEVNSAKGFVDDAEEKLKNLTKELDTRRGQVKNASQSLEEFTKWVED